MYPRILSNTYPINENNRHIIMILHFKGLRILKESFYLDCYINQIKVVNVNKYNILKEYSIYDHHYQQ